MEEIKIVEKPDWISWDDIHELLLQAHKRKGYRFKICSDAWRLDKGKVGR